VQAALDKDTARSAAAPGEVLYQTLFELSPSGILLEDETGRILDLNQALCVSTGYAREELLGKHVSLFVPAADQVCITKHIARILDGEAFSHEEANVRKNGSLCYMELRECRVTLPDGRPGILVTANDVSERKRAEQEREKLIRELRAALAEVRTLSGLLPICAGCKKIRDDRGYWEHVEAYIMKRSTANFTHSICPDCIAKYYPDFALKT
jgi:PAS domain S-box-containing protein